jgi:hypothetical protein
LLDTAVKRRLGRRPIVARSVAAATVGSVCLILAACGGSGSSTESDGTAGTGKPAKIPPSSPFSEPPRGVIENHQLLNPECQPVRGRRWTFPGSQLITSTRYEMYAINYSCAEAKKWVQRLLATKIPFHPKSGKETVLEGPKGYYCSAFPDKAGYAYAGGCKKVEAQKAFGWNWNVSHRRVVMDPADETGIPRLIRLIGSDVETVLTQIEVIDKETRRYVLDVRNTSGIGHVNQFKWWPPPDWTITELHKITGGRCELSAAGLVWCSGKLKVGSCTCRGDGGTLSIEFTAKVPPDTIKNKHPLLFGTSGAVLRITKMTPVPYLVPGTPEAAERQKDI